MVRNQGSVRAAARKGRAAKGFTVIEAFMITAVMGLLLAVALPQLSGIFLHDDLTASTALAVDALREMQGATMSGKGDVAHGVHFESGAFTRFTGGTYNPADPDNVVHDLPDSVSITAITLTGGGADVHFANHKGEPTETGSIELTGGNAVRTIVINAAGMIDTQ